MNKIFILKEMAKANEALNMSNPKFLLKELSDAARVYLHESTFPARCCKMEHGMHIQECSYFAAKTWLELALELTEEAL